MHIPFAKHLKELSQNKRENGMSIRKIKSFYKLNPRQPQNLLKIIPAICLFSSYETNEEKWIMSHRIANATTTLEPQIDFRWAGDPSSWRT